MEQPQLFELSERTDESTKAAGKGIIRIMAANRQQIEMHIATLDQLIPEDHKVRVVWEMAQQYDLSEFYEEIDSIEGGAGRPAIDPRILLAVWLYATSEGIGSAREVDRLCVEHIAYRWLVGGVSVNYHTLSDFRGTNEAKLDQILTESVAALMSEGIVTLNRTAQDGVRVRASAGSGSFRREKRLVCFLAEAEGEVQKLKANGKAEDEGHATRQQAAQENAAKKRVERVRQALQEIQEVKKTKERSHKSKAKQKEARASTTDPEARVMKMPDGGFRPAFNGEYAVDVHSGVVVGVDGINRTDQGQMIPMLDQIEQRYEQKPHQHLVDGGFLTQEDLDTAFERQIEVYAPLPEETSPNAEKYPHYQNQKPSVVAWRERMNSEAGKQIYKERPASIEWVNALARNRGLQQFLVRGKKKIKAVLLWFALTHNLWVVYRIRQQMAGATA